MKFTKGCLLDYQKEWERNRQVFLIHLETEKINYLFFQLNRHKFESTYLKPNFTLEKYAPQFSLQHSNSQIMDIYNAILDYSNELDVTLRDEQSSNPILSASVDSKINTLFEDLFIRFGIVLDSISKAISLFEKRSNTRCLWPTFITKKGEDSWWTVVESYKPFTESLYKIRSDFLHGSIKPNWVVLNRCEENNSISQESRQSNSFAFDYEFHSSMKMILSFLKLKTCFSFFDFLFSVIECFFCFERDLFDRLIKHFCEKYIIVQFKELHEVVNSSILSEYEESIINRYLSGTREAYR